MTTAIYRDACDASAAVQIDGTTLFAAASDEDCVLRVYDTSGAGAPLGRTDVTAFLEPDDLGETEADIEGAAQIGDRIYWIGSHGRSRKGKERKIRQRLFATTVLVNGRSVTLQPVGIPYKDLLVALTTVPALAAFDLADASRKKPEEDGGLNIEGLAPTADGDLLIGFRNPVRDGRALIACLRNAEALVNGTSTMPDLSFAGALDLGGRGVRALEFVPSLRTYLLLAGAFAEEADFRLYRWSGEPAAQAQLLDVDVGALHPEELLVVAAAGRNLTIRLLSDDGTDACKNAAADQRSFRAATVQIEL